MRFANPFSLLWRHRDLVVQFTRREVELRHKGSRLGHLWSILTPMTMLALNFFIFGVIFGGKFGVLPRETSYDYALALLLGLTLYTILAETIGIAPLLIVGQPNYVKKVIFPLEIIPFSSVTSSIYRALLSLLLLLVLALFSHTGLAWGALALPLLLLPLAFMALGLAWGLAAIGVFVRDVNQLIPFFSTALMYASAIVYAPSKIPNYGPFVILRYNPLLVIVDEARRLVLWHIQPDYRALGYAYVATAAILALGYGLFSVLRPYFAEVT